jgi:hypothetical protein
MYTFIQLCYLSFHMGVKISAWHRRKTRNWRFVKRKCRRWHFGPKRDQQAVWLIFFFFKFHGVGWDSPLGTAATVWHTVPAADEIWWWLWSIRWNEKWQGKPAPVPLCPPQIPHVLTRAGNRRLTAWALARPRNYLMRIPTVPYSSPATSSCWYEHKRDVRAISLHEADRWEMHAKFWLWDLTRKDPSGGKALGIAEVRYWTVLKWWVLSQGIIKSTDRTTHSFWKAVATNLLAVFFRCRCTKEICMRGRYRNDKASNTVKLAWVHCKQSLRPTWPPFLCVPEVLSPAIEWLECEPHHSFQLNTEIMNSWSYTFISHTSFYL